MTRTKYTKDVLEPAVANCKSFAGLLRYFNLSVTGGNYRHLQGKVRHYGIDTSHFTGQTWNKGLKAEDNPSLAAFCWKNKISDEEVFVENSKIASGSKLTKRLLRIGWEYKCNCCGINEWLGKPLTLHLDHVNGIHTDNRLDNLRFLCPNCHQQTDTWGNKKSNGNR